MCLVTLHFMLIRYILHSVNNLFSSAHVSPVNHIGGMLISPDSYDNQKLWCNSQLYPTILSAEIISFTRDAPSYFTLMKFLTDPALSVSIFFFLLVYRSLFPVWLYGREGWVSYTYCRGVCIPAGLSILFLLSPPPAPVSSCAARTLPLASHLPLFYTLPLGIQHIPESPITPVRKRYQGACCNQQLCPTMTQVFMTIYRQHYHPGW